MKRCPTCQRTYPDETLNFCRLDGTPLQSDLSSIAEDQTMLISGAQSGSDFVPTKVLHSDAPASNLTSTSSLLTPSNKRTSRKAIDSLAVLPLDNMSDDPDMEYLSDAITESLINTLSQLPKLRVVSRSTVFRYKGQKVAMREIGQQLGVRAVLTGRVRRMGDRLIIGTELIDVANDTQRRAGLHGLL
jgi:TolB-like protein